MDSGAGPAGDFCFVHAADLHLDTPFKGIGQTNEFVARALREASLEAFDALVALCLERAAAFLVIAGDIYDGPVRGVRAQLRFRDGLERLSRVGIPTFVVHGNHDPLGAGWSAISAWPPLVTVFGSESVETVPVVRGGEPIAVVHGISYGHRDVSENLALRFPRQSGPGFRVGLLHCNVTDRTDAHKDYSPCSLDDLTFGGMDYWALGHIHSRMVLSGRPHSDEPWVVYPGNLQARSPKLSEQGAKGVVVVTVTGNRVADLDFVACDSVRFCTIAVDIATTSSIEDLHDELREGGREALATAEGRSVVCYAVLNGHGEMHDYLRQSVLDEILQTLRDEFMEREPWCWWGGIHNATEPVLDLSELCRSSDFAADLVAVAEIVLARHGSGGECGDEGSSIPDDDSVLVEVVAKLPKSLQDRAIGLITPGLLERALRLALSEIGPAAR